MLAIINLFGSSRTTVEGVAEAVRYEIEEIEIDPRSAFMKFMAPNLPTTEIREVPHLTFRVKQFDDEGNPAGYTTVVSSASSRSVLPESFIVDGDEVQVSGTVDDGLLQANELTNLRTETTVTL
jgi:hypothetical protein